MPGNCTMPLCPGLSCLPAGLPGAMLLTTPMYVTSAFETVCHWSLG